MPTHIQKGNVRTQQKVAICKPRREGSKEINSTDPVLKLISVVEATTSLLQQPYQTNADTLFNYAPSWYIPSNER